MPKEENYNAESLTIKEDNQFIKRYLYVDYIFYLVTFFNAYVIIEYFIKRWQIIVFLYMNRIDPIPAQKSYICKITKTDFR